jgi:SMI1-KNR4 cell-wall
MNFSIVENITKVQEQDIQTLEVGLGYALPPNYRNFLKKFNGGRPEPDSVSFTNIETVVQCFFGFGLAIESSNILWNAELTYSDDEGLEIVPIGCDPFGDIFCLVVSDAEDKGVIFLEIGGENYVVHEVAESFEKFLGLIGAQQS